MPKFINADKLKLEETAAFENVQPKVSKIDRELNLAIHTKLHKLLDDAPAENVRPNVPNECGFPAKITEPEKIPIYDLITIIRSRDDKVKAEQIFADNLTLADIKTHKRELVILIAESGLSGEVYRFGTHGSYWEQIGNVCGYA